MIDKIIKYIVYLLSFLILIAFAAVIYGMYSKITNNFSSDEIIDNKSEFLSIINIEKIEIEIIDNNTILIKILNDNKIKALVYDINTKKVIKTIRK